jgi:hypothetical protein
MNVGFKEVKLLIKKRFLPFVQNKKIDKLQFLPFKNKLNYIIVNENRLKLIKKRIFIDLHPDWQSIHGIF